MTTGTVRNCTIRGCRGSTVAYSSVYGGGIRMTGGTVQNCTITNNTAAQYTDAQGGGVYMTGGMVQQCVIANNTNSGGGGIGAGGGLYMSGGLVENCLVRNNTLNDVTGNNKGGGGVYISGGTLHSCTIVTNTCGTSQPGGGVSRTGGVLVNDIIYLNTAANNPNYTGLVSAVTNSCAPELTAGVQGNLTGNPAFKDPVSLNFRLGPGTPCRDTGLMEDWMTGAVDLDGSARLYGPVDMGAYEAFDGGSVYRIR